MFCPSTWRLTRSWYQIFRFSAFSASDTPSQNETDDSTISDPNSRSTTSYNCSDAAEGGYEQQIRCLANSLIAKWDQLKPRMCYKIPTRRRDDRDQSGAAQKRNVIPDVELHWGREFNVPLKRRVDISAKNESSRRFAAPVPPSRSGSVGGDRSPPSWARHHGRRSRQRSTATSARFGSRQAAPGSGGATPNDQRRHDADTSNDSRSHDNGTRKDIRQQHDEVAVIR